MTALFTTLPKILDTSSPNMAAKVIVGSRSHVDYDGFVDHGCYHFGVWGDVTVILLFFGPPLSGVRGVARVIAKVIVGSRSHVDYDGFVHHGCCHFGAWGGRDRDPPLLRTPSVDREGGGKGDREGDRGRSLSR